MVVSGNSGARQLLPKLRKYLAHADEHVRSHAEWAIKDFCHRDELNSAFPSLNSH